MKRESKRVKIIVTLSHTQRPLFLFQERGTATFWPKILLGIPLYKPTFCYANKVSGKKVHTTYFMGLFGCRKWS